MAFHAPSAGQERQNRKILEELEEQKKRLRLQQVPPGAPSTGAHVNPASQSPGVVTPSGNSDNQHITTAQRTALQHAHANSVGYFTTQDSSFGNLILPVLPRLDK